MRFNDRELTNFGENKPDLEGVLHHMKPQTNDWSDWYQQSFKERRFKLIKNLLFYYRINVGEQDAPVGVLVLENAQVAYERPHKGIPFAFSITFKANDKLKDNEGKHIFSCRCDDDVNKWVSTLKTNSYEYWRCQYAILQTKISLKSGKNPFLEYGNSKNENVPHGLVEGKVKHKEKKSSFRSHLETTFVESSYSETKVVVKRETNVGKGDKVNNEAVDNLIDL